MMESRSLGMNEMDQPRSRFLILQFIVVVTPSISTGRVLGSGLGQDRHCASRYM